MARAQAGKLFKANKLYEVLGVARTAKDREIKKAYKKMSLQCHPDKSVLLGLFAAAPAARHLS